MRAAVLQPMYLPWLGYFGFLSQVDVFVFYDDVQFLRDSWQRRNRIKVPAESGGTKWLTVPVNKDKGQAINEVRIRNGEDWQRKHWELIKQAYSEEPIPFGSDHAPYFEEYASDIEPFYHRDWEYLSELTTSLITRLAELLEIEDTEIRYSSRMNISGSKTERVIDILTALNADEYVNGPNGRDYLDVSQFEDAGITLYWHEFDHPVYEQPYGDFESHMSIIDFLFNTGPEAPRILLEAETESLVREPGT